MSVSASGIDKRFGGFTALDSVDLHAPHGAITALLGPSGGGKSTLLRILGGLDTADSGAVAIDGVDVTAVPAQRRDVGFVFQSYAVFEHMSVYRNVAFGLEVRHRPKAEIRRRVDELLQLVRLDALADRLPAQLSGGQRQRMSLARALAVRPRVLLLDEPFGALDATVRRELRGWLRRLHDEMPVTTVFVTHDRDEAFELAEQLVLIDAGRVVQAGPPQQLYDRPANEFVMGFLGPVTRLDGRAVRPHDIEVLDVPAAGATETAVRRVVRLGFEVRVEFAGGVWAQLARGQADALDPRPGRRVWLRAPRTTPLAATGS